MSPSATRDSQPPSSPPAPPPSFSSSGPGFADADQDQEVLALDRGAGPDLSSSSSSPSSTDRRPSGLRFKRTFSREGVSPYDAIEWDRRTASIKDDQGRTVFAQPDCEFPASWSALAANVVASKYFYGENGTPQRERSVRQLVDRVVRTIADWGRRDGYFATDADADVFRDELAALCLSQRGSFNSPVWFNVGLWDQYGIEGSGTNWRWDRESASVVQEPTAYRYPQGSACFIQSVTDDMAGIMRLATSEAMLFKYGSGTGTDLSTLRSSREKVSGGGKPSGPVSFMRVYDSIAAVIKSGGKTRRAAKMQTLKVGHPDIEEFIDCKVREERKARALIRQGYDPDFNGEAYSSIGFQNANLSVRATDEFLRAAVAGGDWTTRAVTTGRPVATLSASALLDRIAANAWECGDPGMQYEDAIQRWHTCPNTAPINSSNPCCVPADALVMVADGRKAVPIGELAEAGEDVWAIAWDAELGQVVAAPMRTIELKRRKAPVVRVHLDDGSSFKATGDHLIMLRSGAYREAAKLGPGDALAPVRLGDPIGPDGSSGAAGTAVGFEYAAVPAAALADLLGRPPAEGEDADRIAVGLDIVRPPASSPASSSRRPGRSRPAPPPRPVAGLAGDLRVRWTEACGEEDVYDGTVPRLHNFAIALRVEPSASESVAETDGGGAGLAPPRFAFGCFIHNSEYMFIDDSACNLASLNLMKFRGDDGAFDVEAFRAACRTFLVAQEVLVDRASYPTERIAANSHRFRPLGLGFANLGSLIMASGLAYDSDEGRGLAAGVTAIMHGEAYLTSAELARALGPFDGYAENREPMSVVIGTHQACAELLSAIACPSLLATAASDLWRDVVASGERHGFRNSQVTVLAPTGTISFMMDCDTTGIEPDISLVKFKQLAGGGMLKIVNRVVPEALRTLGYDEETSAEIVRHIDQFDTIEQAPGLKPEHLAVFDCAFKPRHGERSISHIGHLRMMAACQPFLSGAISKTINMPRESTPDDVRDAYLEGWRLGLKAVAIYRDGSKESQPLNTFSESDLKSAPPPSSSASSATGPAAAADSSASVAATVISTATATAQTFENQKEASAAAWARVASLADSLTGGLAAAPVASFPSPPRRERLPDTRRSLTHKFDIQGHEGYVTIGLYDDGRPGEVFITMAKQGSTIGGLMDVLGTAISIGLQYGVPLEVFVNKFAHVRFEPAGLTRNPEVPIAKSVVDYIFRWLETQFLGDGWKRSANAAAISPLPSPSPQDGTGSEGPRSQSGGDLKFAFSDAAMFVRMQSDSPSCETCGAIMVRCGSCYRCGNCGATGGCG